MLVLIISSDTTCTVALRDELSSNGVRVEVAESPRAAAASLRRAAHRVIFVDQDILGASTAKFVSKIRQRNPEPIVWVTGSRLTPSDLVELIRARVDDCVPKPFDLSVLATQMMNIESSSEHVEYEATPTTDPGLGPAGPVDRRSSPGLDQSLRQRVSRLTVLYQMGRDISENENWSDALDRFLMALVKYTNADGAALLLFSENETRLSPRSNFQVDTTVLEHSCDTLLTRWRDNPRGSEMHCIESYEERAFKTCLERTQPWVYTVIPLRHRSRWWGFLYVEKRYASGQVFKKDYPFLNTIQTILAEEVANAAYISELRQLSRFNQKVLENINSGVITTDLEGYILFCNHLAATMCPRLERNERVHFDSVFNSPVFKTDFFEGIMRSDKDTHVLEVLCFTDKTNSFPARLNLTKMHDDDFNGTVLVGIFEDLTDQKRLENEIRRNDRLRVLGQLSAGMAHEIRNPLTGIATSAEILANKIEDKNKTKYLRAILDETNRLDEIVQNLLNFAKPAKPRMGTCALGDLSNRVIGLLSDQADRKGIRLEFSDRSTDDVCQADANQLTQVLLNIVLNGIQACDRGNRIAIELSTDEASRFARIDISDDGAGVPEEIRGTLFEPFVTTKSQGTGLGLAISQQIVEEHNGDVGCDFLERGTKFTIRLPLGAKRATTEDRLTGSARER